MDMNIPPCAALSEEEHRSTSRSSCNTADIRRDEEIPEMGGHDISLLLLILLKLKKKEAKTYISTSF